MSVEHNKNVVRRFHEELCNQQNFAIANEILDQNIHCYGPDGRIYIAGRDAYMAWLRRALEVLADYRIVYSDLMGEDKLVAFRWTVYATHKGGEEWIFGPVTEDTRIESTGIDIFHFEDGKIVAYYASARDDYVLQQLEA